MTSLSGLVYSTCKCGFLLYESLMSRTLAVSLLICMEQYATQNIIYVGGSHHRTELGRNAGWVVSWFASVEAFAAVQLSFPFFWNMVLRYSLIGLPINSPSYCRRIEFSVGCLDQMWKTCSMQQEKITWLRNFCRNISRLMVSRSSRLYRVAMNNNEMIIKYAIWGLHVRHGYSNSWGCDVYSKYSTYKTVWIKTPTRCNLF